MSSDIYYYNLYVEANLKDEIMGPVFKEYKELFNKYPPFYLDTTHEEKNELIKESIRKEKERRQKE